MSSLTKSKFTPSLNIYSMTKAKDISAKIKTVSLNSLGGERVSNSSNSGSNLGTVTKSTGQNNPTQHTTQNPAHQNPTQNSFRQTGMISVKKFKTTKSSPEKYINDRNLSGDKSKLVQNFMKNSISNSVQLQVNNSKHSSGLNNNDVIEEQSELGDNILDHITKKINKNSKHKSSALNSTNPASSNIMQNLMIGKFTANPVFPKSNVSINVSNNSNSNKLSVTKSNSNIIEEKAEMKVASPRYHESGGVSNSSDMHHNNLHNNNHESNVSHANIIVCTSNNLNNVNNANISVTSSNNLSNSKSNKKYTPNKTPNPNISHQINMNKIIKNITSTSESLLNSLKSGPTNNTNNSVKKQIIKNSMTTPVTNKNSRKNSADKTSVKNNTNTSTHNNHTNNNTHNTIPLKKSNILINSTSVNTSNSIAFTKTQTFNQIRLSSIVPSNYNSNYNSNVSSNTSTSNFQSKSKLNEVNYEEINLITENSKKSQKIISTTTGSMSGSTVKAPNTGLNFLRVTTGTGTGNNTTNNNNTNNNTQSNTSNSLAGSQNFSAGNNLHLFDLGKGNLNIIKNTPSSMKKKTSIAISMPLTNQSSKAGSKNNSKSASRIDEKIETVVVSKKPNAVAYTNNNTNSNNTNSNNTNSNNTITNTLNNTTQKNQTSSSITTTTNNINTSSNITEKFAKKHLTSTNSPTHFPFNFNKDNLIGNKVLALNKTNINTSMKEKNASSISKMREEAVAVTASSNLKNNKPVVSLVMNLSNIKSEVNSKKELNIGITHPNAKAKINSLAAVNKNVVKNNTKRESSGSVSKNPNLLNNKIESKPNNSVIVNQDVSIDSEMNNSTSSVKSTVRESNYYKKEADKISNFITQYYNKNGEYPLTNLKLYKFGRLLGRGAFGKVNLCLHTLSGRVVSIKSFNKNRLSSESSKKKIYHETNLMKNLKHNSIVKIFEVFESQKYILIVMEYVCGGDLLSFVRKRSKLNEQTAKFIFRQIVEALQYIHSQKIVHRDIKLDNILIDLNNTIKVCDFGVSKQITGELLHDQCGTPAYIAPEILLNQGYEGYGVDIWSSGVVLYAMLSGTVPFKATNMTDLHRLILGGTYAPIKEISPEALNLLTGILDVNPKRRLTVEQILNHEWLRSTDEMFNGKIKSLNKLNLFANAERVLLSKFNIDYRCAPKDDLIENFTIKNLDTNQESENQNIATKSYILAPFNSSFKNTFDVLNPFLKIENDAMKFCGKAKEANRNYELNNNGEIDNGILINPVNVNANLSEDEEVLAYHKDNSNVKSSLPSNKVSKHVSKPSSPPEKNSLTSSPRGESHRNSRKNMKDFSITNANTFVLDENVVKMLENIGYKKDYLMKCLYYNELNYATATYYLFLNSSLD